MIVDKGLVSQASVVIDAAAASVWDALVNPATIKQYMFGTVAVSDWKVGPPIVWKGEYRGKKYEDRGMILKFEKGRILEYSHFSPFSGQPNIPENYHTITIELSGRRAGTQVSLFQDNNPTQEAREQTAKFWQGILETLKGLLEKKES